MVIMPVANAWAGWCIGGQGTFDGGSVWQQVCCRGYRQVRHSSHHLPKGTFRIAWLKHAQLWSVQHHPANNHWLDVMSVAKLQVTPSSMHLIWSCKKLCWEPFSVDTFIDFA